MFAHISSLQSSGKASDYLLFFLSEVTSWFIFISGYLFYYLECENFSYRSYLMRKLKNVISPYLLFSIAAIISGLYFSRNVLFDLTQEKFILWSFLTGGTVVGPMWFIPMIAIFFFMTPLFNYISRSNLIYYFAIIFLLLSIFSSRPIHNSNPLLSFFHFLGFYLLGIVAAKSSKFFESLKIYVKLIIMAGSIAVFIFSSIGYFEGEKQEIGFFESLWVLNYISLGKLALLIGTFFCFEQFFNREKKVLGFLARISFGLFFIHGFMSLIFNKFFQGLVYDSLLAKIFCEIGIVVLSSILIVMLLKLVLRKWSRYAIGC